MLAGSLPVPVGQDELVNAAVTGRVLRTPFHRHLPWSLETGEHEKDRAPDAGYCATKALESQLIDTRSQRDSQTPVYIAAMISGVGARPR